MDENSFVRSFFTNDESGQHRSRTDSLFGDHDLFAGYSLDPLVDIKAEHHGAFEPIDHTTMGIPMTPQKSVIDFGNPYSHMNHNSHEFELRVPQLATPTSYDYSYLSSMHHHHHSMYPLHHLHQSHRSHYTSSPSTVHDPMLRANTTISTSPAIQVRKFPVSDSDFRKLQMGNHVDPLPSRSISDASYNHKHHHSVAHKVPVQRSTTIPSTTREMEQVETTYKSKGKRCSEAGCTRRAQSNNRCKAHGGGARCQHPGCPKSSQGGGFCRAHGGGKKCEFEGCTKGQQRKGFCYAHGGIRKCKAPMCDKKDRGNGFCIAHGGGKRCSMDGCINAVRKGRYCRAHMADDSS